jgi:hypothetical protein
VTRFLRLAWLVPVLLLGGCISGQTGSPDCVGARECLCDTLYSGGNVLRVRVEGYADGVLDVTVTEDLANVYRASPVDAGARLAGSISHERPCAPGEVLAPLIGEERLVYVYNSVDPKDVHFVWAVPWSDTLDFGADHLLASTEVADVLASPEACVERFPPDPAPPCDDTGGPCTIVRPRPPVSGESAAAAGVLLLASLLRRVSRSQRRKRVMAS